MKSTILALSLPVVLAVSLPLTAAAERPLPSAPAPKMVLDPQAAQPSVPPPPKPGQAPRLTRTEAEQMAIRNNPRISVGHLLALAQHQITRETRAAELPTAGIAVTAEDGEEASRISAGSLSASRILPHAGAGATFTQLITDFGRTRNLVLSQKLQEQASNASGLATTEEIVLATDQAFYDALTAQSVLDVADQTVATRQTTETQISQMTRNKLKSTLDLSFADVNLSQAQLLQLDARNNADAAMARLDALLGLDHDAKFDLADDTAAPAAPPASADPLIHTALSQRPDLQSLTYAQQAAQKYERAERDQFLPSISAAGTLGTVPVHSDQYYTTNWWGAVGVNLSIPVFNGFLYSSQAHEAQYRAQAATERTRDLRDQIVRDVRTSWLQAVTAWQRIGVTAQLLKQANLSLRLAETRYRLGLSSIVELSQAQLQQTNAEIDNTNALYQYRLALATLNYETGTAP
jgi:outer membrane protein